jgi:hypothetical protein
MPDVFTQWKEAYASHAINRKWSQVFPSGVRQGFWLSVTGTDEVTVGTSNPDGSTDPTNVALVERGGYHLTVREDSTTTLTVPSTDAVYHVVVEAEYEIGQTTTSQVKIVEDGNEAAHEVIVGSVRRESDGGLTALPRKHREPALFVPPFRSVQKTADESVSATTLQDDNDIKNIGLLGGSSYLLQAVLIGELTGDLKMQWAVGANATVEWGYWTSEGTEVKLSENSAVIVYSGSRPRTAARVQGRVEASAPETLDLQWASNGSGTTTLHKPSSLTLIEQ